MALTAIPAGGMWMPRNAPMTAFSNTALIDATGEKAAFIGPVWTPTGGTKSVRKVGFKLGTVVKAGGSVLTVSLQDVDAANGPPWRPDETQDQTYTIANANAAFVTNGWLQTGNFSADRSVAFGEMLAVVIEYDGAGRLGADTVQISGLSAQPQTNGDGIVLKTGGTWATLTQWPNVLLEFSDGTFGCLGTEGLVISAVTSVNVTTATTPDEIALEFQVPWDCQVDACWCAYNSGAAADYQLIIYGPDEVTPLTNGTITVDANQQNSLANITQTRLFPGRVDLTANTTYKLTYKPTTTNATSLNYYDVDQAGYMAAMEGGTTWRWSGRTDAGAWTATTTRRPQMGLRFVSFNPVGGSGVKTHPGMTGGMRG